MAAGLHTLHPQRKTPGKEIVYYVYTVWQGETIAVALSLSESARTQRRMAGVSTGRPRARQATKSSRLT
jgi:hypothetical protein